MTKNPIYLQKNSKKSFLEVKTHENSKMTFESIVYRVGHHEWANGSNLGFYRSICSLFGRSFFKNIPQFMLYKNTKEKFWKKFLRVAAHALSLRLCLRLTKNFTSWFVSSENEDEKSSFYEDAKSILRVNLFLILRLVLRLTFRLHKMKTKNFYEDANQDEDWDEDEDAEHVRQPL